MSEGIQKQHVYIKSGGDVYMGIDKTGDGISIEITKDLALLFLSGLSKVFLEDRGKP